jgi:hypothetical protein
LNAPIREGFLRDDESDADKVIELGPPAGPKVEIATPRVDDGRALDAIPNPPPAKPARAQAEAPPPLDLDAPPPEVQWPVILKLLYKPTRNTKNEIISELTLRAPTAKDIRQCGNPVRLNASGDVIVDEEKMIQMLATLANVYPPMIESLDARDWTSCAFFLQRFFLPNSATWIPAPIPS